MLAKKILVCSLLILLCPLTPGLRLDAHPQNRPIEALPPPVQIQQSVTPPPDSETKKDSLPPLQRSEIVSWGFRVARTHPFL